MELDNLYKDNDYIIGIHRTGYTYITPEIIDDIFRSGLINNGHMMQGAVAGELDIESTVSLFNDFTIFMNQLKAAHGYKNSQGVIIVKIPKSYLGQKDGEIKPIYYKDGNLHKLLPEFIYGYIPTDDKGRLGNIKHNPNYKDKHNLNDVNLEYDNSVYAKLKNGKVNSNGVDANFKYKIIEKAYKDTLIKYGKNQAQEALLRFINENEVNYFTSEQNRSLLRQYISNSEILPILSFFSNNLGTFDECTIIQNFIDYCNLSIEQNIENNIKH